MLTRRRITTLAAAVAVCAGAAASNAAPVSVHPKSIQVSRGDVTITRTSVSDAQEVDYTVSFVGPLKVHGWSHTGALTGTSSAVIWETFTDNIPNFDVATADRVVTGQCAGGPDNPVDDTTTVDLSDARDLLNRHGYSFDCVLSHDGGTPWQVIIKAQTQQSELSPDSTRFSGTYSVTDAETSVVGLDENVTYGDAQLTEYTDDGGGVQWGPLRLSGQIMIGTTRYRGDLVTDTGPYVFGGSIPDMTVSGSANGLTVSGDCSGVIDGVLSQVTW
ncbi:MAG: hypothetical protein QOJ03_1444, partial [Frankiaceae bacterium]|nr:hypothetical protein [Frankiaceae bacterium]